MTKDHMSWCYHHFIEDYGEKYSPKMAGVISFCTKRSSTCTIACFLLSFFSSYFFTCRWIFCLCCSFLGRFKFGWDSCFLQCLLRATNVQPSSLYNIDSLSKQRWKRVSWRDTCACFDLDNSHWIVPTHVPSVLGGTCNGTGSKDPNVTIAYLTLLLQLDLDKFFFALQVSLWDFLRWNISPSDDWRFNGNDNSSSH